MSPSATLTEADILAELIAPDDGGMTAEAARSVLEWKFSRRARAEMRRLIDRNNKGTITPAQQSRLDSYRRVGLLIDFVQEKARISLGT